MRTTSVKNIYLKEYELKQAIVEHLEKTEPELAQHLYDNSCSMDWGSYKPLLEADKESEYFVVSIDGETDEKDYSIDIKKSADKVINQHGNTKWYNCAHCDAGYPDQECTCGGE